jgi:hypothetical protein
MILLRTNYELTPIPFRSFDWCAYDAEALDYDYRGTGWGETEYEAILDFVRKLLDEADVLLGETR